ncbi:MAG: hypothetical protein HY074_13420 [Deltaproteobacteria bacterium]|nr:hypothetical protein [Deltaproteobacteria bacterium]
MKIISLRLPVFVGCAVALFSGCAGKSVGAAKDWNAAMERELATLPKQALPSDKAKFSGEVEAQGAPAVAHSTGLARITIPLGTEQPISCFVYYERISAGDAIQKLFADIVLGEKRLGAFDVGVLATYPYLYAEAAYGIDRGGEKFHGTEKIIAVSFFQNALICLHDEVGYRQTFRRVVEGLAASLKIVPANSLGTYVRARQIHRMSRNDAVLGYTEDVWLSNSKNLSDFFEFRSQIDLGSGTAPVANDVVFGEEVDSKGRLKSGTYLVSENGQLQTNMKLESSDRKNYRAAGLLMGRKYSVKFAAKNALLAHYGENALLAKFASGEASESVTVEHYLPTVKALGPFHKKLWLKGVAAGGHAKVGAQVGKLATEGEVDGHGYVSATIPSGQDTITLERLYTEGAP